MAVVFPCRFWPLSDRQESLDDVSVEDGQDEGKLLFRHIVDDAIYAFIDLSAHLPKFLL